jgi:hypothetical protein
MAFLAIMEATEDGRVAKHWAFPTEAEADAHVAAFLDRFPDAFTAPEPAAPFSHWRINTAAQAVTIDPPAPPVPANATKLRLVRALRAAGKWGAVKAALAKAGPGTNEDWSHAHLIERTDPIAAALGLTDAELDAIFIAAEGA